MFPEELGYYPYAFIGAAIGITAAWAKGLNPYLATFAGAALGPLAILFFLASPDVPKKTSIAEARAKWERTPLGKWLYLTVIIVITFSALTFFYMNLWSDSARAEKVVCEHFDNYINGFCDINDFIGTKKNANGDWEVVTREQSTNKQISYFIVHGISFEIIEVRK